METIPIDTTTTPRVFINCPFDAEYEPLFDALVFVAVAYNFMPTTSYADDDVGVARIRRLREKLQEAPYSIHDLSRCTGEGELNVARMNMPFELGMAMMRQHLGESIEGLSSHQWAAFVPAGHLADQFISDLAGFDLLEYDGENGVQGLIARAAQFFFPKSDVPLTPLEIRPGFDAFREEMASLREQWHGGQPPWSQVIDIATKHAASLLEQPASP